MNGNEEMCSTLLGKCADVNAQDDSKHTPLMIAIYNESNKCAKLILGKEGVDVNLVDKRDSTALHFAAMNGNEEMCGTLLGKCADVNAQDDDNRTPLMIAIYNESNKCSKLILGKEGVDVNLVDKGIALRFTLPLRTEMKKY